ncbi:MAG: shikimate kinase [Candidatus Limnocylindria bacterium]
MTDVTDGPRPTCVLLLGMMGSGKSSVGRALAGRTGWPFIDNDALVERATGLTARELLRDRGEDAMRQAESEALRAGLAIPAPAIVATAAGTILRPEDRDRIDDGGFAVWLHAPAPVLAARAAGAAHRPWLDDDPVAWFTRSIEERAPLYRSVADLEIDTGSTDPEDAADRVVACLSADR